MFHFKHKFQSFIFTEFKTPDFDNEEVQIRKGEFLFDGFEFSFANTNSDQINNHTPDESKIVNKD